MKRLLHCTLVLTNALLLLALGACSGTQTAPADTAALVASGYSNYAWRSEPLTQDGYSRDRVYQADPAIRSAIDERMGELGYRLVARNKAEFLVDYAAATGFNDSRVATTASNVTPYPSATINRVADGASVDNAYALGGIKETGNVLIAFVDAETVDPLWQVRISALVQNANRVDSDAVRQAIRKGLATLPEAP